MRDLQQQKESAPGNSAATAADVIRWLRYFAGTHLFKDPGSVFKTALMSPIKSLVFQAAEKLAIALPAPDTQWPTITAMGWEEWPALEMITVGHTNPFTLFFIFILECV